MHGRKLNLFASPRTWDGLVIRTVLSQTSSLLHHGHTHGPSSNVMSCQTRGNRPSLRFEPRVSITGYQCSHLILYDLLHSQTDQQNQHSCIAKTHSLIPLVGASTWNSTPAEKRSESTNGSKLCFGFPFHLAIALLTDNEKVGIYLPFLLPIYLYPSRLKSPFLSQKRTTSSSSLSLSLSFSLSPFPLISHSL